MDKVATKGSTSFSLVDNKDVKLQAKKWMQKCNAIQNKFMHVYEVIKWPPLSVVGR